MVLLILINIFPGNSRVGELINFVIPALIIASGISILFNPENLKGQPLPEWTTLGRVGSEVTVGKDLNLNPIVLSMGLNNHMPPGKSTIDVLIWMNHLSPLTRGTVS